MLTVRCTAKLLKRLPGEPAADPAPSTTRLGEWYATILVEWPAQLVLLVNELTRLAVILPARPLATLALRIPDAVARVIFELGVSPGAISEERRAMEPIVFAKTASRSVLGTMNEIVFERACIREMEPGMSDLAMSMKLARMLMTIPPHGYEVPAEQAVLALANKATVRGSEEKLT
jgi:hypothetical protein